MAAKKAPVTDALGIRVCESLGIDPGVVSSVVIEILPGSVPHITLEVTDVAGVLSELEINAKECEVELKEGLE